MPERISTPDEMQSEPPVRREPVVTTEPIVGIPIEEVIAWVESWYTEHELPPPEARRVG